ncbi:MAG: HD-GYP domain-containing protein [Xanthobacteraceae bacterium]|nr:HD-GYP domain-containing protein [Xanthobacteraceae bacterium]
MTASPHRATARQRLLLASDDAEQSSELAEILGRVGDVETVPTADLPDDPMGRLSGVVVDINLRSPENVQRIRSKLTRASYQAIPRLFVLSDGLHHSAMQAWALGATDTIERPLDARAILRRVRAAFPNVAYADDDKQGTILNKGVSAAHLVMVKIFQRLPAGKPLSIDDVTAAETQILHAIRKSSLREWLAAVGRHHNHSYRHCLFVTGFVVAFAQHLGMREQDQRRLARAALLHDVGKAFVPVEILDKPGALTEAEREQIQRHPRLGHDALASQGSFPPEVLDVVLHHHEFLDGSGYPDGLSAGEISDIVRIITIADIHTALVEKRAYRLPFTHARAFAMMEGMEGKLDPQLLQAFRPVALGT